MRSTPMTSTTINTNTPAEVVLEDALLDIVDDRAWLRVDGYLPGRNDIPVNTHEVRRLGLRRGDKVNGIARTNGRKPATLQLDRPMGRRPDFYELTALYPQERLRLETDPKLLTTRVIDLAMPIGKGQRALIVAPPKAGKTTILKQIAQAIAHNNPEVHLMVVLVDERPEEVTDFSRTVDGEIVAATFDRPPHEHAALAELAIERAKRLVEQGQDVVVLLDSITRLGRAYNLMAPGRGRTLTGGLDASALHPPKRFLGAARNIDGGGSLTIIATALVENGSAMDTVIFEEFKSTGNAELKLDRTLAEGRIFPAIDLSSTGTRHDETLLSPAELAIVTQVRRVLGTPDAMRQLLDQLRGTTSNNEFLRRVAHSLAA
ncbi:transcription termination factor Rho [Actinoplanes sp. Pm04-4]|uniref:Transcription termination factor Rho n=2 Tax=Paractinoplanes pyxinae TaxID=2997416 RepID=A0ABT4B3H4_9ACTN|nr:transcription termination factor Rho [Actinoplanes pyxinae]